MFQYTHANGPETSDQSDQLGQSSRHRISATNRYITLRPKLVRQTKLRSFDSS